MSEHDVRPKAAVVGQLGNMHGNCPMSDRYARGTVAVNKMATSTYHSVP